MNAWRILRQRAGFTLVELMITMVIFVFAMAAAAGMFSGLMTQFKQQSRIAETNIESTVGLELLRRDLQQAGNGIPWNMDGVAYTEVDAGEAGVNYNDAPNNPPRALVIGNGAGWTSKGQTGANTGSDELAIKASSVATNATCQKWTFIAKRWPPGSGPNILRTWGSIARENLDKDHDYVVVINPVSGSLQRTLVHNAGTFYIKLGDSGFSFNPPTSDTPSFAFEPYLENQGAYVVYGIKDDSDGVVPSMPFNRADYYIDSPDNMPSRCASSEIKSPNLADRTTGVLYKSVISHKDNKRGPGLPILDCVADMQVVAEADTSVPPDGTIDADWETVPPAGPTAAQDIGARMKEVRVYILAHEGQKDSSFQFTNFTGSTSAPFGNTCATMDPGPCPTCIHVGDSVNCTGHIFDLSKIPDYLNYRWKVYTLTVATNLR